MRNLLVWVMFILLSTTAYAGFDIENLEMWKLQGGNTLKAKMAAREVNKSLAELPIQAKCAFYEFSDGLAVIYFVEKVDAVDCSAKTNLADNLKKAGSDLAFKAFGYSESGFILADWQGIPVVVESSGTDRVIIGCPK